MQKIPSVQPELTSMSYFSVCRVTPVFKSSKDAPVKAVQIHVALQISPTQILGYAHLHHTCLFKCPKNKSVLIIESYYLRLFFPVLFWMEDGIY